MSTDYLPLFPLNAVLFPGMILPLHIFEDRYRLMVRHCHDESRPFGVLLIQEGGETGETAVPHKVGTTARITRLEPLADGRMNITTIGVERFRVLRLRHGAPYLQGEVEPLLTTDEGTPEAAHQAELLRPRIQRYLGLLARSIGLQLGVVQNLPEDPTTLAFLTAIALQISSEEKQRLLAIASVSVMLSEEKDIVRREGWLLRFMVETGPRLDEIRVGPTGATVLN